MLLPHLGLESLRQAWFEVVLWNLDLDTWLATFNGVLVGDFACNGVLASWLGMLVRKMVDDLSLG